MAAKRTKKITKVSEDIDEVKEIPTQQDNEQPAVEEVVSEIVQKHEPEKKKHPWYWRK